MVQMVRVDTDPIPSMVFAAYRSVVAGLGSDSFYKDLSAAVERQMHVDRLYVFDGRGRADALEALVSETEEDKPPVSHETYAHRFLPVDPIQAAIDAATADSQLFRVVVRPSDIVVPAYREMLLRSNITERVSFVERRGRGWRCATVARRGAAGGFSPLELAWLGGFWRLVSALIDRHRELVGEVVEDRGERLAELEQRFATRYPQLTLRERQICARAAIGISIEGTALDLGIGTSSVLTYRKRAYQRLEVTSAYELARLVMR